MHFVSFLFLAVQLIESSSFMAALEGTAAQKASLVRKKKIVPKTTSTTNVASTNATTSAGQNKNDILIAKPQVKYSRVHFFIH